jgi:hypothetical protein
MVDIVLLKAKRESGTQLDFHFLTQSVSELDFLGVRRDVH